MNRRFVCIHGHFYQPPRENPWSGEVERQRSAAPFHDWNARIAAECYAPNASAEIHDERGRLLRRVNNYRSISFNVGPTLAAWLERHMPDVHAAIVAADRASPENGEGRGGAIAQIYNHMIAPLANPRDLRTQLTWGLRDFEHRFGRGAEGLWLPETAVDIATLESLAAAGIGFTILAPHQAARVREPSSQAWVDVDERTLDCTRAYRCRLPSGAEIALFFYDAPISRAVAFEGILDDGRELARRLAQGARVDRLTHIATDGESYGHHHARGEMALAAAIERLQGDPTVSLIHYGDYLSRFGTQAEVEIVAPSSWSCSHGVDRWRRDCGCGSSIHEGWNQRWRAPLREAFDALRDALAPIFESQAATLLRDPWAARDEHIGWLLRPTPATRDAFLTRHGLPGATRAWPRILGMLECQRFAMLMYTSCGWFFEELDRIEPLQVLRYAGCVVQQAARWHDVDLEPLLTDRLRLARSNRAAGLSAADLYRRHVTERQPLDSTRP